MPTARKCLLTMLGEQLTPMMKRTVGNPEIACDLDERLLTRLCKFHRFYLEFLSECSLRLFHGPFPFCGGPLFQVYLPHFLGSRPPSHLLPAGWRIRTWSDLFATRRVLDR